MFSKYLMNQSTPQHTQWKRLASIALYHHSAIATIAIKGQIMGRHEYLPNVIWRIFANIEIAQIARGVGVNHASKRTSRGVACRGPRGWKRGEGSSSRNFGGTLHNVGGDSGELLAINQASCSSSAPYGLLISTNFGDFSL